MAARKARKAGLDPGKALEALRSSGLIRPDAKLDDVLKAAAKLPGRDLVGWVAVYDSDKYCFIVK